MSQSVAMNIFVENVRAVMQERGLTASAVAERAGMSQPGLSRVLNGTEKTTIDRAERIASAIGVSLSELFSAEFQKTSA